MNITFRIGSTALISLILGCARLDKLGDTFRPPNTSAPTTTTTSSVDSVPPSIVTGITFSGIGSNTITVGWGAASDNVDLPAQLQYKLVKDDNSAANIISVGLADAKTGADLLMDWTTNTTTFAANALSPLTTYYFVVLVRDSTGNIGLYSPASQSTASLGTLVSPVFSPAANTYSSGQNITMSSSNNSGGSICYTTDGNFPSATIPGTCSFGTQVANGASINISANGSTILRAMATKSGATNSSISSGTYVIDIPPVSGTGITFTNITQTSLRVNWGAATDAITPTASLQYKLVKDDASTANINSVALANAKSGSDLLMDWTANTLLRNVTGLTSGSTFYFAVLVRDAVGNMALYTPAAQKLNGGIIDSSFNPSSGSTGIQAIAVQTDGKILIGGSFTTFNGVSVNYLTRLNSDGSLDPGFNTGTGPDSWIASIAIQSDGKILIGGGSFLGGGFTTYNGTSRKNLARLNSDGSLDTSFDPGTGADSTIRSIKIQSDGKIVLGGYFANYNGVAVNYIVRINTDGSRDATFNSGTGADNIIHAVAIQSDGKILIGGGFANYNGTGRSRIARINSNGTIDATFNPGTGVTGASGGGVLAVGLQSDGKILIGGNITAYNGTAVGNILRANADGSNDTTFISGIGFDNYVRAIAIQSDGKSLIAGDFSNYNGTSRNRISRVNIDGSLDATLVVGTGLDSTVFAIDLPTNGTFVLGGAFTTYNGTTRKGVVRIVQ